MSMTNRTFIVGVGMSKFDKPGTKSGDYPDWAKEAGLAALQDAGIGYEQIEQAYAAYCYGDSTYGEQPEHYAWIGWKNQRHSVNNPYAQFQDKYSLQEIKDSKEIFAPLTKLQCSPTSDGAACVICASEDFVERHDLFDRAVELA